MEMTALDCDNSAEQRFPQVLVEKAVPTKMKNSHYLAC